MTYSYAMAYLRGIIKRREYVRAAAADILGTSFTAGYGPF